jgi:hypothetical protein
MFRISHSNPLSDENALDDPRKWWSTVLYSMSRIWLLLFLTWRAKDRSGDSRFEKIKPFFFKFMVRKDIY